MYMPDDNNPRITKALLLACAALFFVFILMYILFGID